MPYRLAKTSSSHHQQNKAKAKTRHNNNKHNNIPATTTSSSKSSRGTLQSLFRSRQHRRSYHRHSTPPSRSAATGHDEEQQAVAAAAATEVTSKQQQRQQSRSSVLSLTSVMDLSVLLCITSNNHTNHPSPEQHQQQKQQDAHHQASEDDDDIANYSTDAGTTSSPSTSSSIENHNNYDSRLRYNRHRRPSRNHHQLQHDDDDEEEEFEVVLGAVAPHRQPQQQQQQSYFNYNYNNNSSKYYYGDTITTSSRDKKKNMASDNNASSSANKSAVKTESWMQQWASQGPSSRPQQKQQQGEEGGRHYQEEVESNKVLPNLLNSEPPSSLQERGRPYHRTSSHAGYDDLKKKSSSTTLAESRPAAKILVGGTDHPDLARSGHAIIRPRISKYDRRRSSHNNPAAIIVRSTSSSSAVTKYQHQAQHKYKKNKNSITNHHPTNTTMMMASSSAASESTATATGTMAAKAQQRQGGGAPPKQQKQQPQAEKEAEEGNEDEEDEEKKFQKEATFWKTAKDPKSGRTYWYHWQTRETQWRKPICCSSAKERKDLRQKEKQTREFFAAMETNILQSLQQGTFLQSQQPSQQPQQQQQQESQPSLPSLLDKRQKPAFPLVRTISTMEDSVLATLVQRVPSHRQVSSVVGSVVGGGSAGGGSAAGVANHSSNSSSCFYSDDDSDVSLEDDHEDDDDMLGSLSSLNINTAGNSSKEGTTIPFNMENSATNNNYERSSNLSSNHLSLGAGGFRRGSLFGSTVMEVENEDTTTSHDDSEEDVEGDDDQQLLAALETTGQLCLEPAPESSAADTADMTTATARNATSPLTREASMRLEALMRRESSLSSKESIQLEALLRRSSLSSSTVGKFNKTFRSNDLEEDYNNNWEEIGVRSGGASMPFSFASSASSSSAATANNNSMMLNNAGLSTLESAAMLELAAITQEMANVQDTSPSLESTSSSNASLEGLQVLSTPATATMTTSTTSGTQEEGDPSYAAAHRSLHHNGANTVLSDGESDYDVNLLHKAAAAAASVPKPRPIATNTTTATNKRLHTSMCNMETGPLPAAAAIERPGMMTQRRNTCGTLYVGSTLSAPDKDATIRCVCGVYRAHILQSAARDSSDAASLLIDSPDYQVFEDLEGMQHKKPLLHGAREEHAKVPSLDEITRFYRDVFGRAKMETDCIIMSLIYVERLIKITNGILRPRPTNWRSLLFSCMVLSSKVWDDLSMWNADFSLTCPAGVRFSLPRVNELEIAVLSALNYKVKVPASEYAKYYFLLRSMLIKSGLGSEDLKTMTPLDVEGARQLQTISSQYQSQASCKSELKKAAMGRSKTTGARMDSPSTSGSPDSNKNSKPNKDQTSPVSATLLTAETSSGSDGSRRSSQRVGLEHVVQMS